MTITFVLGGARSGKSAWAQKEAERLAEADSSRRLVFMATAQAHDAEMEARIARHRADRDARWRTLEAPYELDRAVQDLAPEDVALIDCLTLWLSNALLADQDLALETSKLADALITCKASLVIVSNEVSSGIVPDNPLARRFRDEAGRLHQTIASLADDVRLLVAGLPIRLKGA